MSLPRICLYSVGDTSDQLRAETGSMEDWFAPLFAQHPVTYELFDARSGRLPDPTRYAAIVTTGSRSSLTEPEPWMEAAVELVRQAYTARIPLLGICFGHQLISAAFGGSVIRNPIGWQVSTRPFHVREQAHADPLFAGVEGELLANWAHQDIVIEDTLSPLNGIQVLASSPKAAVAAVAAGPKIRGVQFHPEITGSISRTVIKTRHDILAREADELQRPHDHPDKLISTACDATAGEQVFHNFLRHFVLEE